MDLAPFATSSDLAVRLGVTFTVEEAAQVDELLADACDDLRSLIGQPLNRLTSEVVLHTDTVGKVYLPAVPVISVASVKYEGEEVEYKLRHDLLTVPCTIGRDEPIAVTYTHGWEPVPRELVKWACVMAVAVLQGTKTTGALGLVSGVGRRQESIDDYTVIVDGPTGDGTASTAMSLPDPIIDRLRAAYGGRAGTYWVEVD